MTASYIALLLAGAACGGFISGMASFGTALFALGWWLQIMPPKQAVAIVLFMSVVSGVQGVITVRHAIDLRRLARFVIPGLIGIPIGLQLLAYIETQILSLMIAGFMLLYGAFFLSRRNLPNLTQRTPIMDSTIGFSGGVLGAMAGLSGALPTMWISMRDWTKQQSRAVLQPYNLTILGISAILLAFDGAYDRATLISIAIALPVTMIATRIGLWVFGRLNDAQFRYLLVILLLLAGIILLLREIL